MPTINATVYPDEAYVLVQVDWLSALLRDSFTRTLTDSWGTPDIGPAYTIASGVASNFDVNGLQGTTTHAAINTNSYIISPIAVVNVDLSGYFTNTTVPAGAAIEASFFVRYIDGNNYIRAVVFFNTTGTVTCLIEQANAGVFTNSAFATVPGVATTGVYGFRIVANATFIGFRFWNASVAEPLVWHNTFTASYLLAGGAGVGTRIGPGSTNTPPISFAWDNLLAFDPNAVMTDCATVTRRNTVTGEIVTLRPYVFYTDDGALMLECGQGLWWDTEPPLNVELEYCVQACDAYTTVTVNPDFETGVAGWTVTGGSLTQDCTVSKVGLCSGSYTPTGSEVNPAIFQDGGALAAGVAVKTSGWVRTAQGWNSVFLRLSVTYEDFSTGFFDTPMVTLDDNEWRYLELIVTPTKNVTSFRLGFGIAGQPPNTTVFKVDDLKVAVLTPVSASDCVSVTVESDSVWLKNPLHPCLDVEVGLCSPMLADCEETARVSYVGTFEDSYEPNTVLLSPVNRAHAIPINRIRRAPAAVLRLLAHDCDARDAVLEINEPGDPLLFQAPADYCIPDRYISVRTLSETRISVDQREDFRLMTLPYVTVERPAGPSDGICGARIEDLCDIFTSWGALAMAGLTWEDLLLGEASTDGPGQEVPADARTWGEVETEFTDWLAVEAGGTRDWGELRDGL